MKRFLEYHANKLIQRGIISKSEKKVYIYGLEVVEEDLNIN